MNHILYGFIPLAFIFLIAGLISLSKKKNRPVSAPRTNTAASITETIILFSAGCIALICISCFNNGILLKLRELRPAFAMTHIIITAIAAAFLLSAALLSWFGRTAMAVILMTIIFFSYNAAIDKAPFEGPGYIMARIAPKDSWVPVVNYTFEINNGLQGVEVWINGVFLGTTPFKMTGDEFNKKVLFLTEPPEGFAKAPEGVPQENWKQPEGNWFKVQIVGIEKEENISRQGISYLSKFKDYYAKIKYAGEWGINCIGTSGGGGDFYQYDYEVSLNGHFSVTDKIEQENRERFNKLLQKARLADYKVDKEWLATLDTYGERGWRDVQKIAENEKELSEILDRWVKWKYGISDDMTQKQAGKDLDDICHQVDIKRDYSKDSFEGRAIELVYDKLDVEYIVKKYEKILKSRNQRSLASAMVLYQVIELWDKKLNDEEADKTNIIEKKITPELIKLEDFRKAAVLGGPEIEKYLLRQYQREKRIEGVELGYRNYEYTMGMFINKWLYHLAFMKSPVAQEFQEKNRQEIMKLAELIINNNFNRERNPPEFLFYDLNLGEKSMAYEYWASYSEHVESSFPSFWWEILKKRWDYLNRLGSLATEEMYVHCWKITKRDAPLMGGYLQQALIVLPPDKRKPVTNVIVKELLGIANKKRQEIGLDINAVHYFQEDEPVDMAREFLVKSGDEESFQWLFFKYGRNQKNYLKGRLEQNVMDKSTPEHSLIQILAKNEDSELRKLSLEAIRKLSTAANRKILEKLLNDSDEQVRSAAKQVAAELEEIKNTPVSELVSEPKGN
ncbi:MAG: HEAT repeat domain-containing protein [Sedimentisphaerales bacterium]|nr:HEAT repeat domain-containing protein [Sedimentisphaerales bacterium]